MRGMQWIRAWLVWAADRREVLVLPIGILAWMTMVVLASLA